MLRGGRASGALQYIHALSEQIILSQKKNTLRTFNLYFGRNVPEKEADIHHVWKVVVETVSKEY